MARQGQGLSTRRKEHGFKSIFKVALGISKAEAVVHRTYWHLDLHAGSGFNERVHCDGSPVVFLDQATHSGRPFHATFCDMDRKQCDTLERQISSAKIPSHSTAIILCMDSTEALKATAELISRVEQDPKYALGTCLCDPNGPIALPLLNAIEEFSARFHRIDIILNLNVSWYGRRGGCYVDHPKKHVRQVAKHPKFKEIPEHINKKHKFIRNPSRGPGDRFTILFGSNWKGWQDKMKSWADFYPLESPEGQEILHTMRSVTDGQGYLDF